MKTMDAVNLGMMGVLAFVAYKSFKGFQIGVTAVSDYAGAKIDEYQAASDLSSQIAFEHETTDPIIADIARRTGLDLKTMDDVFKAERDGLIFYQESTGQWVPVGDYF